MIHLVLDTNIFHQEGLYSRNMQLLSRLAAADQIMLHIPEVVKREYLTKRITDATTKIQESYSNLGEILKKTDRENPVHENLASLQLGLNLLSKTIDEAINIDFEKWQATAKAKILPFEPHDICVIFNDYFHGGGVFRQPKSREDFPDAFINSSIQTLKNQVDTLDVILKDGAFRQHLQRINGFKLHDSLGTYLRQPEILDVIATLDARSKRTEELKDFFSSAGFQHLLTPYLLTSSDLLPYLYVHVPDDEAGANLDIEHPFGTTVDNPIIDSIKKFNYGEVSQIGDGHFSIEINFTTNATVRYCANYLEYINLSPERKATIDQLSLNGEGICDLSERREVHFMGHVEVRFNGNFTAKDLSTHVEYLDSAHRKVEIDIEIDRVTL